MSKYRQTISKEGRLNTFKKIFAPLLSVFKGTSGEILNRGVELASGIESRLRNPDELLDDKNQDLRLYDRMMLDDRIKFTLELKKALALHVDSKIVPASDDEKDLEIADFVKDNFKRLNNPTWSDVMDNLLDSMVYGHKEGEIIWDTISIPGKWIWKEVKFQHPIFFDFEYDEHKNLLGVPYGREYGNDTVIPAEEFLSKFIYMINPYLKDGNWYGDSDLREVYFDWWSKFNIKRWRNVYLQNFGMPVPVAYYEHKEVSGSEKDALEDTLKNWQDQMYLMIPATRDPQTGELRKKIEIDWRDTNTAKGTGQYSETLMDLDRSITRKLLLPDKLGFTDDKFGSKAQSGTIIDILSMVISRIHKRLEDSINPKVRQLVDLNFMNVEEYPRFQFDDITKTIEKEMLQTLIDKGVVDKREKWIRQRVRIPELTQEEKDQIEEDKEEDKKNAPPIPQFPQIPNPGQTGEQPDPSVKEPVKNKFKMVKVDFQKIKNQFDTFENDFIVSYDEIFDEQVDKLTRKIQRSKIIENKDLAGIKKLQITKKDFKDLFSTYYAKLYLHGKSDALDEVKGDVKELKKDGEYIEFQVDDQELAWLNREWIDRFLKRHGELGTLSADDKKALKALRDKAFFVTGETSDAILKTAFHTLDNGIRSGKTVAAVVAELKDVLTDERKSRALTIARTNSSDAYNSGRMNTFTDPDVDQFIQAFQYNAIIDGATTAFCREHNEQIILKNDPALGTINPPNHFNCRSLLVAVVVGDDEIVDDNKPFGTDVTADAVRPATGFGG